MKRARKISKTVQNAISDIPEVLMQEFVLITEC